MVIWHPTTILLALRLWKKVAQTTYSLDLIEI
jgi:hypothetical protein